MSVNYDFYEIPNPDKESLHARVVLIVILPKNL